VNKRVILAATLSALGLGVALASALADFTPASAYRSDFGWKQAAGVVVGIALIGLGPAIANAVLVLPPRLRLLRDEGLAGAHRHRKGKSAAFSAGNAA